MNILDYNNIAIITHQNPDGDALGSAFSLLNALRHYGKDAQVVLMQEIPKVFNFIESSYLIFNDKMKFDTVISVDCSSPGHLGKCSVLLEKAVNTINIDHHVTNTMYAKENIIKNYAAACEVVYEIIEDLEELNDPLIASWLYIGMSTDTGGFRFPDTTKDTHIKVANLLEAGIDIGKINRILYNTFSMNKYKAMAKAIESIEIYDKITFIGIRKETISELGEDSISDLVQIAANLEGTEVGIFLKERCSKEIKVSMRSIEYVDLSKIATEMGGGGHKRAAGYTSFEDFETAKAKILERVKREIK